MYFDSHVHVGCPKAKPTTEQKEWLGYSGYVKTTPEKFIKTALAHSVIRALAFPFPFAECGVEKLNAEIIKVARKYPYFFTPLLLSPTVAELEKVPDIYAGVKGHFYVQGRDELPNAEMLEYLESKGKVYLFHAHSSSWEKHIKYVTSNFKKLRVVIAHCARLPEFVKVDPLEWVDTIHSWISKRSLANVYFDTSNIRKPDVIRKMVERFGAEHILWGSDYPYSYSKGEDVIQSEIEVIEKAVGDLPNAEMIRNGNFRRLYLPDEIEISLASVSDAQALGSILSNISDQDSKFLALHLKIAYVRDRVRKASHILVARGLNNHVAGFLRWSDRSNDAMVIEELYVHPDFRGKGIAQKLVENLCASFKHAEAKSFAENTSVAHVFKSQGFTPRYTPKGTMINWRKDMM